MATAMFAETFKTLQRLTPAILKNRSCTFSVNANHSTTTIDYFWSLNNIPTHKPGNEPFLD
jgi:hypothetical protein